MVTVHTAVNISSRWVVSSSIAPIIPASAPYTKSRLRKGIKPSINPSIMLTNISPSLTCESFGVSMSKSVIILNDTFTVFLHDFEVKLLTMESFI